jgi:beta-galactosidase
MTPLRPENPVPYVNQKGVVARDLTPKESFYVFQSYWAAKPMAHIYGHTWPVRWGKPGEPKMLKVYSNCDTVELFLNGKSLGMKKRNSQDFPAAGLRWETPFLAGKNEVKAVGRKGDQTVNDAITFEYETRPWGAPARFEVKQAILEGGTATVEVKALDAAGRTCLDAATLIRFALAGDGKLIDDQGTPGGSRQVQLANGRASIQVKTNNGPSVVSVSAKGLPTAFVTVGTAK